MAQYSKPKKQGKGRSEEKWKVSFVCRHIYVFSWVRGLGVGAVYAGRVWELVLCRSLDLESDCMEKTTRKTRDKKL